MKKIVDIKSYYNDDIYWPENAEGYQDENTRLPDTEYIIQEILHGRPVGLSMLWDRGKESGGAHAVVLDGYDSSSNKFHLNYGWGGDSNEWYTLKRMINRGIYQTITGIVPVMSPVLEVKDLAFDVSFIDRSEEDATLRFSIANTGKEKSTPTVAAVYCGTTFLTSLELDYVSPGSSRDCSCSFDASDLAAGENTITVKVCSQKEEGDVSSTTGTVRVYDGAITDTDDTWNLAAAGGSRTRIVAEYDAEGNMAETVLAEDEYIGCRDLVDFREATIGHAGKYTFTLSGFTNDLELALYSLTAKNTLKLVRSLTAFAPADTAVLSEVPLEKGTYYISVRAANEETPGDSDYRLVFSGAGNQKANNSDDWTDLEHSGIDGAVGSVGVIDEETGEIITGGWVGLGDEFDYRLFELPCAAKTSFTIDASDAVKFTVYEIREKTGKKGVTTYSLKSLQSVKVKAGVPATTKGLLLSAGNTPGKYCFSVQSTNASKGGSADYAVTFNLTDSVFYSKGDNSDDWTDLKTNGAAGAVGEACVIADGGGEILSGWVGFGDAVDYKAFTLGSGAKLSFTLGATDAAKFTVWKLNEKTDKKGVTTYSLKSLQSTKLAKNKTTGTYAATTKSLLLDEGTYYFSVESTNAAKGGNADYTVALNAGSCVFYADADDGANNWLYAKKTGLNWALHDSDAVVVHSGMTRIRIDRDEPDVVGTADFVGYGDEADYLKIRLEKDAVLSFTAKAADACKFVIYSLTEGTDKKGNAKYSAKALQTTKLSNPKGAAEYAATTKALSLAAGDYYISMQSTNAKKGGCAYYNISLNQDACAGLPDEFEIQDVCDALVPAELDDLNSARYASDELADAFAFGGFASQNFIWESCTGLLAGL